MAPFRFAVLAGVCLLSTAMASSLAESPVALRNPSFEADGSGWQGKGFGVGSLAEWAAPGGRSYATTQGSFSQEVDGVQLEAGATYTLHAWARALTPRGARRRAAASVALTAGGAAVASATVSVSAPQMKDPQGKLIVGDDGANVFLDGEFRVALSDGFKYQLASSSDPVKDPWKSVKCDNDACDAMAKSPLLEKDLGFGLADYGTFYVDEGSSLQSRIELINFNRGPDKGGAPNYIPVPATGEDAAGPIWKTVLSHKGDESPWVMDAYTYYDREEGRLWMIWGGHQTWVSELDTATGMLKGLPVGYDTEFTGAAHAGLHHRVLSWTNWEGAKGSSHYPAQRSKAAPRSWEGDALSPESSYQEGPSLYKRDGFWYACASYGSMGDSYTIRCCRSSAANGAPPTGRYVDKNGVGCTEFDKATNGFGNSVLLADEGEQAVPGHPWMWREEASGREFLGFDFRKSQSLRTSNDFQAIRELFFVDGWPTIWTPVEVSFTVQPGDAALVGKQLGVRLGKGQAASDSAARVGFDLVSLTRTRAADPTTPTTPPSLRATAPPSMTTTPPSTTTAPPSTSSASGDRATADPTDPPPSSQCKNIRSKKKCKREPQCAWSKRRCGDRSAPPPTSDGPDCAKLKSKKKCRRSKALGCSWAKAAGARKKKCVLSTA